MLSRHSRDRKEKYGRVIEGMERNGERADRLAPSPVPSLYLRGLDRLPASPTSSRTDEREVGMIYARHAEASVTVCLMHRSSLDPLLPPFHPATLRSTPFFLLSFRGCFPPPSLSLSPFLSIHYPTLSSSSTAVKAARSRGNPPYTHVHISRTRDERPVEG